MLGKGPIRIGVPLGNGVLELRTGQRVPATRMAVPFAVVGKDAGADGVARNLGAESLAFDRPVRLRMVDPDGQPAQGAEIGLVPLVTAYDALGQRVVTDGAGRCDLLVKPGEWLLWSVSRERGFLVQRLEVGVEPPAAEQALVRQPLRWATGQVMAEGRPVAGASLDEMGMSRRVSGSERDQVIDGALTRINQAITSCRTDADGRFRLPYVPVAGVTMSIDVDASGGSTRRHSRFQLPCEPQDPEPLTIEIQ